MGTITRKFMNVAMSAVVLVGLTACTAVPDVAVSNVNVSKVEKVFVDKETILTCIRTLEDLLQKNVDYQKELSECTLRRFFSKGGTVRKSLMSLDEKKQRILGHPSDTMYSKHILSEFENWQAIVQKGNSELEIKLKDGKCGKGVPQQLFIHSMGTL